MKTIINSERPGLTRHQWKRRRNQLWKEGFKATELYTMSYDGLNESNIRKGLFITPIISPEGLKRTVLIIIKVKADKFATVQYDDYSHNKKVEWFKNIEIFNFKPIKRGEVYVK